MSGFLVNVSATAQCPHAAKVTIPPGQQRVLVGGEPVATVTDQGSVAGCPFQVPVGPGTKPQPCVTAGWLVGALRVRVGGQAALLEDSSGLCKSAEGIPQGPPSIGTTQVRVQGA